MSDPGGQPERLKPIVGRGTSMNTPNRFESIRVEPEWTHFENSAGLDVAGSTKVATEFFVDDSQSVVSENHSPDLRFRYSVNPYRGCSHGCSYCYARPYHEYLGLSAGLDFETKIFVKLNAPQLLRKWLARKSWQCEPINLSGVTDPYQPAERKFELTRDCLKVACECRQPMFVITKNALITRDLDLLADLAYDRLIRVVISVTSLQPDLIRVLEPRTSTPAARLRAIEKLADKNIPVAVNVAPIIFGLNDHEVPSILHSVSDAGATMASYTVLRLPGAVEPIFLDWIDQHYPDRRQKIENGIRSMREGKLASPKFYDRMMGTGVIAEQIRKVFKTFARTYRLDGPVEPLNCDLFRRPDSNPRQQRLF